LPQISKFGAIIIGRRIVLKEILTPDEAEKRGLKKYFTGRACKKNHISERWLSSNQCVECNMLNVKKWQKKNKNKLNEARKRLRNEGRKTLPPSERVHDRENRREKNRVRAKISHEKHVQKQIGMAGRNKPTNCEICKESEVRICFDHCHDTNLFRGWLCVRCNSVLGLARDDISLLGKLIAYLESFKEGLCTQSFS
jgi:hypothetical protein